MSSEKSPYPPEYSEIYPNMNQIGNSNNNENNSNMGWRQTADTTPINPTTNSSQQPPAYGGIHSSIQASTAATQILQNQSRVGLYPIQLNPCPHCSRNGKTFTTHNTTWKTHLFALILCVACCWCCVPLPYMTNNSTKIINHFCEHCQRYIGSFEQNPFR
ncbi:hypothetical protein PVAND_004802 [Polypedilum vanderplanki]|uniref:LITAF domain-containing protein n=1 Tax=Polypedilum vanderplanki TaxID=319348 RepID=A0A9J6BY17_POLVA|nr:hypothetical protein PVAND_004802 [Polypedilum vanderplanki]